jgi:hypothetical protein
MFLESQVPPYQSPDQVPEPSTTKPPTTFPYSFIPNHRLLLLYPIFQHLGKGYCDDNVSTVSPSTNLNRYLLNQITRL